MSINKTSTSLLAFFIASSGFASATEMNDIPSIVVTATRTADTVDETLFPVSIISRDDIKRIQAKSLYEVLQTIPGISLSADGGLGSNSSISLRGTNSGHVLILVDGMPIHSATVGTTAIQFLPIAQIERIEVVRGSRSSLYGSEAIGGVIQIFTNNAEKNSFQANIGGGSDDTKDLGLNFTLANQSSQLTASLSAMETNGYDFLGYDSYGVKNSGDSDNDGYNNYALSLNGQHRFNEKFQMSAMFLNSQGKSFFDGYSDDKTHLEFDQQAMNIGLDINISNWYTMKFKAGQSKDNQENHLHNLGANNAYWVEGYTSFKTTTELFNWQNEFQINDANLFTLGSDYQVDKVNSSTNFSADSRDNSAIYGQFIHYGEQIDAQLSLRYDDNEAFGSHTTWGINGGYALTQQLRLTASLATAFKAPTFNDLYWPADAYFKGNPDLKPEQSTSADLGISYKTHSSSYSLNYYQTEIEQLIAYVNSYPDISMMENVNKAKIKGIELTIQQKYQNWLLQTQLSTNNPVDDDTGHTLSRRSKRNASISLDYQNNGLSYGASAILSSGRYNKIDEQDYIPGYGVLNLRTAWEVNKNWTLKAKVNNVFDKQYTLTKDFNGNDYQQPDRTVYISAHYTY
ncbi:MAG: TonB-dependent receptor [Gammaproteobacteria bacterium]|nr:TonB-dependent receptor [Gammaproteobacteria bacterium]